MGSVAVLLAALVSSSVWAQGFNSGSDESDGALNLTEPGTVLFDPSTFNPPLDPDNDGVYRFTTINIAAGVTVRLAAIPLGTRPVFWLATGDVQIDGILDLSGEDGYRVGDPQVVAIGGAGGFEGGLGRTAANVPTPGNGPGGGDTGDFAAALLGGGGSYVTGGKPYGNNFLQPLLGGSGGGGGGSSLDLIPGGGGGSGGGALLIASSTGITVNGSIAADGGHGGNADTSQFRDGGGGSGGGIRLVAPVIRGTGTISNAGGLLRRLDGSITNFSQEGSPGRTRLEASQYEFTGDVTNAGSLRIIASGPGSVLPPANAASVRVVSVAGVPVPPNPASAFSPADLNIDTTGAVQLEIEAQNVPIGTVVNLRLVNETEGVTQFDSAPLAGTQASSTATASVTIPPGFSRFTIEARFTP